MNREDWTLENDAHKMWAEGKQSEEPTLEEIVNAVRSENYEVIHLDVDFDKMMGLWTWFCAIAPIKDNIKDIDTKGVTTPTS